MKKAASRMPRVVKNGEEGVASKLRWEYLSVVSSAGLRRCI